MKNFELQIRAGEDTRGQDLKVNLSFHKGGRKIKKDKKHTKKVTRQQVQVIVGSKSMFSGYLSWR